MPTLTKTLTLEVTPEQFLNNCSIAELMETALLVMSPRYQNKVKRHLKDIDSGFKPADKRIGELVG